ncbi:MAG: FAD-linked oxidase C-terminal domain-containing protein [Candidatus Paceibacteria bacterium]
MATRSSVVAVDVDITPTTPSPSKKKTSVSTSKASARKNAVSSPKKASTKKKAVTKKPAVKKAVNKTAEVKDEHTHTHVHTPIVSPLSKTELLQIKRHPLGHLLLEKKLREAGFHGGVSTDKRFLKKYSTDESIFAINPQVVLQPKNKRDIEIATKLIAIETKRFSSLSLTPRAAGTGLSGGSLTDSIVIDVCTHLHHIGPVEENKGNITITCEPGAMWRDVEKKLKRHDAYLPPYTSSKDICSIGGSIANNAAGPDSLRYGHCADWVESLDVVLADGHTYTLRPLTYKEFTKLIKEKNEYARIAKEIFSLIEKNEKVIEDGRPKTQKNSAGYALWDVISTSVAKFKKGDGTFDLTRVISGSQGTVGIITSLTLRALRIQKNTTLITLPIFDLQEAASAITKALEYNPINIEIFDALTFDLALKNPSFFKDRLDSMDYYKVLLSMYTTYHVRYGRKTPEFTILITLDEETTKKTPAESIAQRIKPTGTKARVVSNPIEAEMLWQIRRASYSLSKFQDPTKRPAAFLEDMTVPPENLSKFFIEIKKLFKEFNVTSAVHGHGGNGHFHFYPLLDFTQKTTALMVERMAEKFYATAIKYKGNICGEHNDGIIRTPHLSKVFSKQVLDIFKKVENIFDPDDIFNPGKKVNPRFDIKSSMRKTN